MSFLSTVFGRTAPTSETVTAALARVEADLAAVPARIAAAEDVLKDVASMTDADHAAAIAAKDAAVRSAARLEQQAEQLRGALADVTNAEVVAALKTRATAAQTAVDADYVKLDAEFEKLSAKLADVASKMVAIDEEVAGTNRAILAAQAGGKAGLPDLVIDTTRRHRFKPGAVIEPERTVTEDKVMTREDGRWVEVGVTETRGGKIVLGPGEQIQQVERVVPERRSNDRSMRAATDDLSLPATRLGGKPFWPRAF